MANPENFTGESALPSGYLHVEQLAERLVVDEQTLPWLNGEASLGIAECQLATGETFLLASAVGTSDKLIKAANGMTEHQKRITDNMFYSRLPEYIAHGHAQNVDLMACTPATPFPIHVMRNHGGQRVYFAATNFAVRGNEAESIILKLGVCDKNKQALALSVLSNARMRTHRKKLSE